jgi:hypothetical protein
MIASTGDFLLSITFWRLRVDACTSFSSIGMIQKVMVVTTCSVWGV